MNVVPPSTTQDTLTPSNMPHVLSIFSLFGNSNATEVTLTTYVTRFQQLLHFFFRITQQTKQRLQSLLILYSMVSANM